jgi:hypothetical protein
LEGELAWEEDLNLEGQFLDDPLAKNKKPGSERFELGDN